MSENDPRELVSVPINWEECWMCVSWQNSQKVPLRPETQHRAHRQRLASSQRSSRGSSHIYLHSLLLLQRNLSTGFLSQSWLLDKVMLLTITNHFRFLSATWLEKKTTCASVSDALKVKLFMFSWWLLTALITAQIRLQQGSDFRPWHRKQYL